jgi:5-hydroxyisourate hydrolase-like protein (transthyretin family)
MCLQRNNKGIILLEKIYPLEFAIDCFLNENIPMKMRSYFATMLISLHIDKDPLEEVHVPILTRVWHEIAGG